MTTTQTPAPAVRPYRVDYGLYALAGTADYEGDCYYARATGPAAARTWIVIDGFGTKVTTGLPTLDDAVIYAILHLTPAAR
jgi:hypothetical protein